MGGQPKGTTAHNIVVALVLLTIHGRLKTGACNRAKFSSPPKYRSDRRACGVDAHISTVLDRPVPANPPGQYRCLRLRGGRRSIAGDDMLYTPDAKQFGTVVEGEGVLVVQSSGPMVPRRGDAGLVMTHCLTRRCVPGYYFPHNSSTWAGGVWDGRAASPCEMCGAVPMRRCAVCGTR